MLKWLLYVILADICTIFCYITNPIAVLFANEEGELDGFWKYWQTWDDSLDVDFMVKEVVPSIFRYDFDSKYISGFEITPELSAVNRKKGCVQLREGATFTLKERIQRYFCRVLWLTRNCSYGFAFWWFGVNVAGNTLKAKIDKADRKFFYDDTDNPLFAVWTYKDSSRICGILGYDVFFNTYLGWKINEDETVLTRCMIANRIAFKIKKKDL